ncbi:DNA-binding transcriptional LysR family regulator [Aequitasia blattaphilus]|uniref:LysR family transcriptional regulator n=1 Tax=Aequitasia blattaphilus TaxID=2949332 RepID=A0ABT1E5W2_9FIRM|nr:LysR family transcriptional regulator [Aequitasia blattaphilus]MCP1101230.1 LysR family transcriptional regulator [Aequitasia blattaphilus]MCR8613870.1 LysR family transcriptional regulator [Aequitasia blattaphilus]
MEINFELYKVFYYVARSLSFSGAARELYISQSAVSQSIKTLEKRLGVTLFVRSTKKVYLSEEGEVLLRHIEPAFNLIQRGENVLLNPKEKAAELRIGASDTICRYFLLPFLKSFHKTYKDIHIKVINATSLGCVELLENNQVDFIVVNAPHPSLQNIPAPRILKEFHDVFLSSHVFDELKDKVISFQDLLSYPILMLDKNSTTSAFLHRQFNKNQLELNPEIEVNSNDLLIDLAKIGLGIAFLPDYCINTKDKNLFVVHTKDKLPKRQLVLGINENSPVPELVENFISLF